MIHGKEGIKIKWIIYVQDKQNGFHNTALSYTLLTKKHNDSNIFKMIEIIS